MVAQLSLGGRRCAWNFQELFSTGAGKQGTTISHVAARCGMFLCCFCLEKSINKTCACQYEEQSPGKSLWAGRPSSFTLSEG